MRSTDYSVERARCTPDTRLPTQVRKRRTHEDVGPCRQRRLVEVELRAVVRGVEPEIGITRAEKNESARHFAKEVTHVLGTHAAIGLG